MRMADIPFECEVIPFGEGMGTADYAGTPRIREVLPTGKVPVLHHDGLIIPDSMAILEYLADLFPDRGFGRKTGNGVLWREPYLPKCIRDLRPCAESAA